MPTVITVRNNGNLRIEGDFVIHDAEGNPYDLAGRTATTLCRCGHSEKKPFCDSTHKKIGFESVCHAYTLAPPAAKA